MIVPPYRGRMGTFASVLDAVLPVRCVVCRRGEELLCASCLGGMRLIRPPLCSRCGAPTAWPVGRCGECAGRRLSFRSARSAVAYEGAARTLVAAWKERGLRSLGAFAAELVAAEVRRPDVDVLTFVPGDAARTSWRGVNAAEALARELGGLWALPAEPLLRRGRDNRRQRGLTRGERRTNVRGLFVCSGEPPRRVCLVDDVYTTGATALAAATELRRAGARSVDVLTFARAVRLGGDRPQAIG